MILCMFNHVLICYDCLLFLFLKYQAHVLCCICIYMPLTLNKNYLLTFISKFLLQKSYTRKLTNGIKQVVHVHL